MGIFRRKKTAFNASIVPDCAYCRYNSAPESAKDTVVCPHWEEKKRSCRRYQYDPTRRMPQKEPELKQYDPSDFSL